MAELGTAMVLASAIYLLGVEVDCDMAMCKDLWERLRMLMASDLFKA